MVTVTLAGKPEEVHDEARRFFQFETVSIQKAEIAFDKVKPASTKAVEKAAEPKAETKAETPAPKTTAPTASDLVAEVKSIIPKLVKELGREKVVALLGEFNAKKGDDLNTVEVRANFLKKANSLLPKE
jgi:hypothetical protein